MGDPNFRGESFIIKEGLLGCPNPTANLIGVYQAYDIIHFFELVMRFLFYPNNANYLEKYSKEEKDWISY